MTRLGRIPLAPAEGWLTVGLLLLTVMTFAWSLDNAEWVLRRGELTDFLSGAAFLSVIYGVGAAKAGWARWLAHALGAVFAALVVPILVGGALLEDGASWLKAYEATASAMVQAYLGHMMLVFGLLVWATGQFAAYTTFGHRRPLAALVVVGLLLIANMSATFQDQLWYLVIFSLASLLLLVRLHAFDEQSAWLRRRIGDPATVAGIYLRGGTAFVSGTVIAALLLTGSAKSAPLAGAWGDFDQRIIEFGQRFQGLLQSWGPPRLSGVSFGPTADISGVWQQNPTPAVEIQVAPGDASKYYWRVYAYDTFTGNGWALSETASATRAPDTPLLAGTKDDPGALGRVELKFSVRPLAYGDSELVGPNALAQVDIGTTLDLLGPDGFFATVERPGGMVAYNGVALVPTLGEEEGELNRGALRGAGTEYPPEILERYLDVPEGTIGPEAEKLLTEIEAAIPRDTPYDRAATIEAVFHDGRRFTYDANLLDDPDCGPRNTVECFAWSRRGYCQQYASTMVILLRKMNVPSRLVQGFLPGERAAATGVEILKYSDSHAWVEVWFPGYGWVNFDPTGGNISEAEALPAGVDPSPTPVGSTDNRDDPLRPTPSLREDELTGTGSLPPRSPQSPAAFIAVGLLLLIAVGALAFIAWRRGPRSASHPGRPRPSTSTRRHSATSCRPPGRRSRRSPARRSRWPTAGASSATTGSAPSSRPTGRSGFSSSGSSCVAGNGPAARSGRAETSGRWRRGAPPRTSVGHSAVLGFTAPHCAHEPR